MRWRILVVVTSSKGKNDCDNERNTEGRLVTAKLCKVIAVIDPEKNE